MKRYAFLVRGINVGGRHKVVMEEFCRELEELGMSHVSSYINSGNLFFDSTLMKEELLLVLEEFLNKAYPFIKVFSLFTLEDDFYRKDVLLFTERLDKNEMKKIINSLELKDEILHFGQLGVYWVKYDKSTYSQTAYHKKLLKTPFYPDITIRNARTFSKIGHFLSMK